MQDQKEIKRLTHLTNPELFTAAKVSVQEETNSTLKVLYILREIERRRAFAEKSYPSLFEFCTDYLGYKKDAAYRRLSALKALKDLPEVEEKIKSGSLDLMNVSQAQSYFAQKKRKNEPLKKEEKLEILEALENKSTRESEEFFLNLAPREVPQESIKQVNPDTFDLRLALPIGMLEKLNKLKMLMGSENSQVDTLQAIDKAFDITIEHFEKLHLKSEEKFAALGKSETILKTISIHVKRHLWKLHQGQCSHVDQQANQRCSSKYKLEVDHIIPRALGGTDEVENLRLVCRAHNQWAAIQKLGLETMEPYLRTH